jgi:Tol biopolymer transport system component
MAYIINGNLYFQDGSKPPLQLTHSGQDWQLISFSDDGEKVFFIRGKDGRNLYSINTDGTQEQTLITSALFDTFGSEYDKSDINCNLAAVPHTHKLLFSICSYRPGNVVIYHSTLFLVDSDTRQVKKLFMREQGGTVSVSPDGSMLAVDKVGYIDVIDIDGKMIYHKLATYMLSEPTPIGAHLYWSSDSKELIVATPVNTYYEIGADRYYTIWRYSLDTGKGVQINLEPSVIGGNPASVSPDGNRIVYSDEEGIFKIGDLITGHAQVYIPNPDTYSFQDWSSDNTHFIYDSTAGAGLHLGSLDSPPVLIGKADFVGWLDANQYLYLINKTLVIGKIDGEPKPILVGTTQSPFSYYFDSSVFIYQP